MSEKSAITAKQRGHFLRNCTDFPNLQTTEQLRVNAQLKNSHSQSKEQIWNILFRRSGRNKLLFYLL